jgi:hypothetical protein
MGYNFTGPWSWLFYPVTVLGSAEGSRGDDSREYAASDPAQYFVFSPKRSMTLAQALFSQYPYAVVVIDSIDDAGTGTASFYLTFCEERIVAYLLGQNVKFDDGTEIEIAPEAAEPTGQSFDFSFDPADPVFPQYVTELGGMESV